MFGFYNLLPYKVERMHYFPLAVIWCAPKADIHWNIIPKITIFSNNKKMFSYVGFHISLLRNAMTRSSCQRPNSTGTSRCQSFMCQDAIHREIYPNSFFLWGVCLTNPSPQKNMSPYYRLCIWRVIKFYRFSQTSGLRMHTICRFLYFLKLFKNSQT